MRNFLLTPSVESQQYAFGSCISFYTDREIHKNDILQEKSEGSIEK